MQRSRGKKIDFIMIEIGRVRLSFYPVLLLYTVIILFFRRFSPVGLATFSPRLLSMYFDRPHCQTPGHETNSTDATLSPVPPKRHSGLFFLPLVSPQDNIKRKEKPTAEPILLLCPGDKQKDRGGDGMQLTSFLEGGGH
ncbi:hypothetical protein CEXT_198141 [Caerostris extrusa]|uniref:Transmembrane protein n=1 Tax=Caerostris extrusa TaxID=172846 RepID=A0AAV4N7R3_CAEEX|nr:hypothetical protein CEXT_198141 [Caerostris extrusa]